MNILKRSAWTSTPNGRVGRPISRSRVVGIAVHYPASGSKALAALSEREVSERLRGWRAGHRAKGWADIGYNYAIDGRGRVWFLTGYSIGAHAGSIGNTTRIGILMVLGDTEQPTLAMIDAFRRFRFEHVLVDFPGATRIDGHGSIPGNATSCPGGPLNAAIKAGVLSARPTPKPTPSKGGTRGGKVDEALVLLREARATATKNGYVERQRKLTAAILAAEAIQQEDKK